MLGLVGIKKNVPVNIREKLVIKDEVREEIEERLKNKFGEFLILSTCNRTEIYFNHFLGNEEVLKEVFDVLKWDINLMENVFYFEEKEACKHLFKVVCGFHSKIYGEDQILGQVRDAYTYSKKQGFLDVEFNRLFQEAIACGKKFRAKSELYEIPVSSSSIVASLISESNVKSIIILGFGEVGSRIYKYLYSKNYRDITIVVRNKNKVKINDSKINIIGFDELGNNLGKVDCIVGATSSNDAIIYKKDLENIDKKITIYDLAIPRDIHKDVEEIEKVEIFNIDDISKIDDKNKALRKERMDKNRYIVSDYIFEFMEWKKLREITPTIKDLNKVGSEVFESRYRTFVNKNGEDNDIAKKMMKSISKVYINNAIDVLKEETLEGRGDECLRIIEKIFLKKN